MWGVIYAALLIAFTVYVALDTFVIERIYQPPPADNQNTHTSSDPEPSQWDSLAEIITPVSTETEYRDEHIHIVLTEYREYDTAIYVADVTLTAPEFLQTALAKGTYGKNVKEKTSQIAEEANAVLAVNGDYYGAREKGFVIRNGTLYRESAANNTEALVIDATGSFAIVTESETTAKSLLDRGASQVLSFGPGLIDGGEITVTEEDEVGKAMASNPRTAIGLLEPLHYVFVVSDGRTKESEGLSLYELAQFMQSLGAETAYNLDGGGSATMVFQGEVINNPTTNGRKISEREVSDIVCIVPEIGS